MKNLYRMIMFFNIMTTCTATYSSTLEKVSVFTEQDYEYIIKNHNPAPFTLLFWSVSCTPCLHEMRLISNMTKVERKNFIFISTDGHEMTDEILDVLKNLNLENEENWVFHGRSIESIISTIDKRWYGETPRSYYFDTDRKRTLLKNK